MLLLSILQKYIEDFENLDEWDLIEELANQRADSMIFHALDGFGMSVEEAIDIINEHNGTDEQRIEVRNIITAAIDNIADFASAQEYQVMRQIDSILPYRLEDIDELEPEELEELLAAFETYNKRYANVENLDVWYAMNVARQWVLIAANTMLMYMTQGDERVRPWHLVWEGYTAPKSMFPQWLIPPIEYQCRCYLVEVGTFDKAKLSDVNAEIVKVPQMPDNFNRVFKESVCVGGRIFSDEHPYFQVESEDFNRLSMIADNIKSRYNIPIYGRN